MQRRFWTTVAASALGVGVMFTLFVATTGLSQAQEPPPQNPEQPQSPLGTAFTYQGQLKRNGAPITDNCLMAFRLYDQASAGNQIGNPITTAVSIANGLFTVPLDFGASAFAGEARWLGIQVKCPTDSAYVDLGRQALTAAPYSMYSTSTGALQGRSVASTAPGSGQVLKWNGSTWSPADDETGGSGNAWSLTGNAGTNPLSNFLGTTDNQALEFKVNSARVLRLEPHATSPNVVGGQSSNHVTSGAGGATIAGGGGANRVTDHYGTVGGGRGNQAGDDDGDTANSAYATVGGGDRNEASSDFATVGGGYLNIASDYESTIGGGQSNTASRDQATIGGGWFNTASAQAATVGGGYGNIASGFVATVGGGQINTASGAYATVPGGRAASASHYGEMAYASGQFASAGDAQTSIYVLRNTTSNATPTELFLSGGDYRLTLVPTATLVFDILIVARSASNNSAGYIMRGIIENDDGVTSFIGTPSVIAMGEDRPAWEVAVTADNANDALVITVTGEAGYTIRWVATVRTVEVRH